MAPSSALGLPNRQIQRPLVIGCGALARELVALTRRAGCPEVDLTCLPATLHNRPEQIPEAVRRRIRRAKTAGRDRIFVAYADCGTGGLLDLVLEEEGVARLGGAHCYEVYAGRAAFASLSETEPGTFYLTDFLARNFDRLVIRGLGLDRHPELLSTYFGNYTRVLYLAQTDDGALTAIARRGARRLGLRFERQFTGYGELGLTIAGIGNEMGSVVSESTIRAPRERRLRSAQVPTTLGPRFVIRDGSEASDTRRSRSGTRSKHESWTASPRSRASGVEAGAGAGARASVAEAGAA